ncbi:MAG: L-aspartate oxidase [Chloroflexi bacterium]|nr:L-aspartate oxidase [Chloroflexota bacterium]
MKFKTRHYDFIIVGSGVAGLSFALGTKDLKGLTIARSSLTRTNTNLAQGGIAAAVGEGDSPELHLEDTLRAGAGLCDRAAVEVLVNEAPEAIRRLVDMGASFDRRPDGSFDLSREGAHSRRRVLHARGYETGKEVQETLLKSVKKIGIELGAGFFCLDLVVDNGRVTGIWAWDENNGELHCILAPIVMLATGGCGELYLYTTNSWLSGGDGFSIAYRAGAVIRDPEMIQFHPTALFLPGYPEGEPLPLITEALRGDGAALHNAAGEQFMLRYHPDGELAPRDITTLAIFTEMEKEKSNCVFLDVSGVEAFPERFPYIYEECIRNGITPGKDKIPVTPAMHYSMGGIKTDIDGHAALPGLYAAGEVSSTGVHGANRLASNSLLEGLVFGDRAAKAAVRDFPRMPKPETPGEYLSFPSEGVPSEETLLEIKKNIRRLLWSNAGIVRSEESLCNALSELDRMEQLFESEKNIFDPALVPLNYSVRNALTMSKLIATGAYNRRESRGAHKRCDFPEPVSPEGKHTELVVNKPVPEPIG